MNRFTRKMVIYYTGAIFASFLVVYFLFNVLSSNYIRSIAERELQIGMVNAVNFTEAVFISDDVPLDAILRIAPREINLGPFAERPLLFLDADTGREHAFVTSFTIGPITPRAAIVDTSVIIIDDAGYILSPNMDFLLEGQGAKIQFLTEYYRVNAARFTANEMRRVHGNASTYYVSALRRPMPEGEWSILMYTDITSAMTFTNRMNQILGVLLVASGLAGLAITLSLSSRFKQSIARLCSYAETIGRGNFSTQPGAFKDAEFAQLSKSMNTMSDMLQAYEAKQKQFFQNASHELRTPLMSIQGFAEGLLDGVFEKKEGAEIILAEGHKMAGLVDELLYASRMDSNYENNGDTTAIDLPALLTECCERIKPIALNANKKIALSTPPGEIFVQANYEKLERAITNILTNAIRHAQKEIALHCAADAQGIKITIQDDGEGINPGDISHIFERFYKGENGNYGLGLAICKDIIKSMGGSITARNRNAPDSGAVFEITLQTFSPPVPG
ncbi:MAG: HAMP domain-containing histidine kinase [Defluviitaleaceae bacterium]|nr:HAMP domain-containing histidine kinase [Defluviitaleaceae bacterium]MCL2238500.1 HAMP domain-containing histidine kinase [Defluviitaleaceae bacterium]